MKSRKVGKIEDASVWQLKYYLYYLKQYGVENIEAKLDYPLLKKTVDVNLTERMKKSLSRYLRI